MTYRLNSVEAKNILEEGLINETEDQTHFLFGRNDVFSFEEDGSVYSVVEVEDKNFLIHDFDSMGNQERKISEIGKEEATKFLEKTGHSPFMRLDIRKFSVELEAKEIEIQKVKQLGFFTDSEEIGSRKVNYGELLKDQMIKDTEKEKEVRKGAEEILRLT